MSLLSSRRRRLGGWIRIVRVPPPPVLLLGLLALLLTPLHVSCGCSSNLQLITRQTSRGNVVVGRRRSRGWLLIPRGGESAPPSAQQKSLHPSNATTYKHERQQADEAHKSAVKSIAKNIVAPIPNHTSEIASATTLQTPTTVTLPSWRASLPLPLRSKGPKTLQKICLGNTDIFLLGTAHVSNDSSIDVRLLLNAVHPDCIFVELCDARIPLLEGPGGGLSAEKEAMAATNNSTNTNTTSKRHHPSLVQQIKEMQQAQGGSRLQALSTVLLTSVQEDYANELGVELGGEFRCAHEYWMNCSIGTDDNNLPRPHLVLGDRPLYLTLVRAWESLRWWPKIKLVAGLLWSSLSKPNKEEIRAWLDAVMRKESDVLTESFQELRKHFPTLYRTIISERDAWLAAKLTQTCLALARKAAADESPAISHDRRIVVVAIVGMGHVPGICQWLTNQTRATTPEAVLAELVTTKRWAADEVVQREAIPSWVYEVSELQYEDSAVIS